MKVLLNRKWRFVGIGILLGYAYHHWVGCESGGCLISSNPWISSAYGGVMGWLLYQSNAKDGAKSALQDDVVSE